MPLVVDSSLALAFVAAAAACLRLPPQIRGHLNTAIASAATAAASSTLRYSPLDLSSSGPEAKSHPGTLPHMSLASLAVVLLPGEAWSNGKARPTDSTLIFKPISAL